jgi:hypothetical protein
LRIPLSLPSDGYMIQISSYSLLSTAILHEASLLKREDSGEIMRGGREIAD